MTHRGENGSRNPCFKSGKEASVFKVAQKIQRARRKETARDYICERNLVEGKGRFHFWFLRSYQSQEKKGFRPGNAPFYCVILERIAPVFIVSLLKCIAVLLPVVKKVYT